MTPSLLDSLNESDRRALHASAKRRRYPKGDSLFHEGDPGQTMHVVMKGLVAIKVTTPLGDVATLTVLGPGGSFGELALLEGAPHRTATASAMTQVETLVIGPEQVQELRSRSVLIDQLLFTAMAGQIRRLTEHLLEALYVPADKRVIRRLLAVDELCADGGETTELPFTQEDIASMAGTTRPTANRVLTQLRDADLLRLGRGRITLLDRSGLAQRAR